MSSRRELKKEGYVYELLSPEERKKVHFSLWANENYGRVYPGGWFYPDTIADTLDKIEELDVRPTDIYVVTMPKSGTTWMTEIVWTLVYNPDLNHPDASKSLDVRTPFLELDFFFRAKNFPKLTDDSEGVLHLKEKIPDQIDEEYLGYSLVKAADDPRIIKSHMPISLFKKEVPYTSKVIYLARDPRDSLVSGYDFFPRWVQGYQGTMDEYFDSFLNAELHHHPYWGHIKEAYDLRNSPHVLLLYFEDLKANPAKEIAKMSEFLGLNRTQKQIDNVAEYTSFANMKKLADTGAVKRPQSDGGRCEMNDTQKKGFFNKGKTGGWKGAFNEEQLERINAWMEKNLKDFPDDFIYRLRK